jgi:putative tryptophan/tyrosine transport system substrate-binding protein
MRRRKFIAGLGASIVAPLGARAQQARIPEIGFLASGPPSSNGNSTAAVRRGLAEAGYVEGRNIHIEYRWAYWQFNRLPALAADLVSRKVAVIISTQFAPPTLAAKGATSTIPIVFAYGGDPVKAGFVASLNRPGGNVTGVAAINSELGGKRLSLLSNLVPQATTIAFLSIPANRDLEAQSTQVLEAAHALGREVIFLTARGESDYDGAFATMVERHAGALIVGAFPFTSNKLVELAARYKIPTMYPRRDYIEAGGLMSYAAGYDEIHRQVGIYAGRILKGERPADLPVILPTKFELIINLKTAKALGLTVPETLLATADEVIQ